MKRIFTLAAVALLSSAGLVRAQVPADEAMPILQNWYQHYLGRQIDQAGINYWYPQITTHDPREVLADLLSSAEYYKKDGDNPTGLAIGLLRDVYGKNNPAPAEVQQWANYFAQAPSRQAAIEQFLAGAGPNIFNPPPTAVPSAAGGVPPPVAAPTAPGYSGAYPPPAVPASPDYSGAYGVPAVPAPPGYGVTPGTAFVPATPGYSGTYAAPTGAMYYSPGVGQSQVVIPTLRLWHRHRQDRRWDHRYDDHHGHDHH